MQRVFLIITISFIFLGSINAADNTFLYPVYKGDKWGYINKAGKLAIKYKFESAEDFSEGVAVVSINGKTGYILPNGKWLHKPIFNHALDFSDGMGAVLVNGKWGFINKKGVLVTIPTPN